MKSALRFFVIFCRSRTAVLGLLLLLLVLTAALFASVWFPRNPMRIVGRPEIWPFVDPRFPLGTDGLGRDIAALIAHGARTTLLIGFSASLTATIIGVIAGAAAGYLGGRVDEAITRVTELFQTVPNIILVLTVITILGPTVLHITLAVGLVSWPPIARLTRGEFKSLRDREFVQACQIAGMTQRHIVFREILPNALPPVIILSSMIIGNAILFESSVYFLGLGDVNVASWGRLIGDGRPLIRTAWYICTIPGIALMFTILALNLIGDGLNDALNPRLRVS